MVELHPYYDKIVVEQISQNEKSSGGIIVPDVEKRQWKIGKVVAVGPGFWTINGTLIKTTTKVGDIVVFPKVHSVEYKNKGTKYFIIRENELYLKLDNYEQ